MATYDLTFDAVSIPTDSGGVTATVEEDSDSDGTVDNSDTVALSDGVTSYTTGNVFDGGGQIRLVWSIGPSSDVTVTGSTTQTVTVTAIVEDATFNSAAMLAGEATAKPDPNGPFFSQKQQYRIVYFAYDGTVYKIEDGDSSWSQIV